jgi:hypothetical protein
MVAGENGVLSKVVTLYWLSKVTSWSVAVDSARAVGCLFPAASEIFQEATRTTGQVVEFRTGRQSVQLAWLADNTLLRFD